MPVWRCPIVGDGTDRNAFRPGVPDDVSFRALHIEAGDGVCVAEVPIDLPPGVTNNLARLADGMTYEEARAYIDAFLGRV
jgi:hypothetical protein